jgi:hypothetical protein
MSPIPAEFCANKRSGNSAIRTDIVSRKLTPLAVIAGLDPAIHRLEKAFSLMDVRVKPAHDEMNKSQFHP